jgi:hypothetical protein
MTVHCKIMLTFNRYLPASLNGANAEEVALLLEKGAGKPSAFKELLNSGPLSPEFSDAIHGRAASRELEKSTGLDLN